MGQKKAIAKAKALAAAEGRAYIALLGNRTSFVIPKDDLSGMIGAFRRADRVYVAEPPQVTFDFTRDEYGNLRVADFDASAIGWPR